ncbi:fungal specific transcription factor domain-containing protein [Aspergillus brunneoviolaceus CBS 621.78]|uniref:Uncharacterized protein n=1 Tax=Aspergillus brunneoviolaceus CBS 621.78 TaxID=1450534 RepID=A0ACD1G5M2_9EURO|nr:hypothetical protein BO95DRAFT_391686 [Aspergillus brunneoviolaceus CBS 621.78]RAH44563.1 hypothetical protein BO95DRAFT_391686 [Aspergillus brunneoviolaceus CBS 621.78]
MATTPISLSNDQHTIDEAVETQPGSEVRDRQTDLPSSPGLFDLAGANARVNAAREPASHASLEGINDLEGHYVGPASGVSFLACVRERLRSSEGSQSAFTFGDAPLPEYDDATPSVMLSVKESTILFRRFFDFTVPIDRMVHQPMVEEWLREFHETMGSMRHAVDAPARRAVLWMIFAMAQEHLNQDPLPNGEDRSIRYFLAADYQLARERATVCLASVQARLYQCFWLLARSRVNHCWSLFGTTARLALALGLHRKRIINPPADSPASRITLDCRRRTFWTAYCLDIHLCLTLGRPRIFHDEDIDQELPADHSLVDEPVDLQFTVPTGYSVMIAPVLYYRLHRVLGLILRHLYAIRPIALADQCRLAKEFSDRLSQWRHSLPGFLQLHSGSTAPQLPILQRQRDVLNLTYWHAVILTNRPLLLTNFVTGRDSGGGGVVVNDGISKCLQAALCIADRIYHMFQTSSMYRSFWATCYYAFTAATVLFVHTIQQAAAPVEIYYQHLNAATRCCEQLTRFVHDSPLVAQYVAVLEELRQEGLRLIERYANNNAPQRVPVAPDPVEMTIADYAMLLGISVPCLEAFDAGELSSGAAAESASWMEFDTLNFPGVMHTNSFRDSM